MAQVSIVDVEMLDQLQDRLGDVCESQAQEASVVLQRLQVFHDQALREVQASTGLLEQAQELESTHEEQQAHASRDLDQAQSRVNEASLALYACEANRAVHDDCAYHCAGEEQDQAQAEQAMAEAVQDLTQAQQDLAAAVSLRVLMQGRLEKSRQVLAVHDSTAEAVQHELGARLAACLELLAQLRTRVAHANRALEQYLEMNPGAAQFRDWLRWVPMGGQPITPDQLAQRMNLSSPAQQAFMDYLTRRDPDMQRLLGRYRAEHGRCESALELHKLQLKVRKHLSGLYAEKVVEYALRPVARVVRTQQRTEFEGGRYTKTDLVFSELTVPVILGRGKGMAAPVGGSIAVEVKCGKAPYLWAQREHMQFQAGGHQQASASMTICSRDIRQLSPEQQARLRQSLRESGSPLIGMLPYKQEIDELCWGSVCTQKVEEGAHDD